MNENNEILLVQDNGFYGPNEVDPIGRSLVPRFSPKIQ